MSNALRDGWQFWIDRGGTFTDVVAVAPDGHLETRKLLSENPHRYADAAVHAIGEILGTWSAPRPTIAAVKMGTTVATNALLERRGAATALVITAGLADAIRIGTQSRPDIFALAIELPEMLYSAVVEADERISATGDVLRPLDLDTLARELERVRAAGIDSIAIVLLHAYRYPQHEQQAAALARELGFAQVSVSHEVSPLMKLVPRGDTTLVDAYLSPVLRRYVAQVRDGLAAQAPNAPLLFMQSHGGLASAERFRGRDSILSGPAAGVVGMVRSSARAGCDKLIGFDMGGTSTDVSLYDGGYERRDETVIAGVRIATPMLSIDTVAAGGGSVLKFASGRLQVGPESAGAQPGPACYRGGGPLTVTDANVLLGRIQAEFFPHVFGADGTAPIDFSVVRERFATLAAQVSAATGQTAAPEALALGFLEIAVERMAGAIKKISIERGHDSTEFALACFGGAGGQHACQVADALGIGTVLIHPLAGLLSAYGMGLADLITLRQAAVEQPLTGALLEALDARYVSLEGAAAGELEAAALEPRQIRLTRRIALKQRGSDTALKLECAPGTGIERLRGAFAQAHAEHFGFAPEDATLVVEAIEIEASGAVETPPEAPWPERDPAPPSATRPVWFATGWIETPIYARDRLARGQRIDGPALIWEANATTLIEAGWSGEVSDWGHLRLTRREPRVEREQRGTRCDPVLLEIFNYLFMHIAEQMGVVLQHTAHSVNIKERLDFSCALFDADGSLIANAPHMPVHLGSMGDSVATVLAAHRDGLAPGDVYMLNAPYNGGTHLPDITVVTPHWDASGRRLEFILACRAHHADVGGSSPGSMPADSTRIDEEGVVLDDVQIIHAGRFREAEVRGLFSHGPYPSRNPDQNVADLKAQIAANARGARELERLTRRFGTATVHAYMRHIKRNAEDCVRRAIDRLHDGRFMLELDGGERITVAVAIDHKRRDATIDFTGTSPMSPGNFNAPRAITRAAVLYVFRALVRESIPLNAGCLAPLKIVIPEPSLLAPRYPAAVVAGNVETSQCIVDALLAALGAAAASQGTMNNLTFGNAVHQYYETLCGGAGAGPGFDGASAVHTHMTNSRLTDIEVLEWRYPVLVRRFAIRRGSGGAGAHRGGDGIVRVLEFTEPVEASILANRRRVAPFGLAGGGAGARGSNYVRRADGTVETLAGHARVMLGCGDAIVIETPGGGGYGAAS